MTNLYRLLRYLRPYASRMTAAIGAMMVVAAASVTIAALFKPIFDEALQANVSRAFLLRLAGVFVLTYLVLGIARFLSTYLMGAVGFAVVRDLRVGLFRHLQLLPIDFLARHSTGGLMSRVTSDVLAVQEALSRVLVDLMREALTLVGLVAYMFYIDWFLSLLTLTVAPVVISIITRMSRKLRRASREAQEGLGDISSLLQEALTGIRIVKAFCMEGFEAEKFRRAAERLFRHALRAHRLDSIGSPLMEFIGALGGAAVLIYGALQITTGGLTIGDFASFLIAAFATYAPLRRLSSVNARLQMAAAAADRLFEILDTPAEPGYEIALPPSGATAAEVPFLPADCQQGLPMPGIVRGISFERVRFAYRDLEGVQQDVLHDVDFEIPAGSAVALVGSSGAGKTTIANLIPRFYDPTGGGVCIDGVDIREIRLADLRGQIGMVSQETILFNDTVRNNIAYGQPSVSDATVEEAARAALAHGFIENLQDGYATILGEQGFRLSGGQRQRVAIARALLKNAPILILDEATSNLDERSEQQVQKALANLMQGRTTLIIAHRLTTVRRADLIVVLDKGRVVEVGTHGELLTHRGLYSDLYSLQFADAAEAAQRLEG
ncbi:MAG: ABC transporter ATP-binding protein [Acidobacteriota bacterium]